MSDAQNYYDSLLAQGNDPASALKYTQQNYPEFAEANTTPSMLVGVPADTLPSTQIQNDNSNKHHNGNFRLCCIGVGGIAAIIARNSAFQYDLNAEEKEDIDIEQEIIDKENR